MPCMAKRTFGAFYAKAGLRFCRLFLSITSTMLSIGEAGFAVCDGGAILCHNPAPPTNQAGD